MTGTTTLPDDMMMRLRSAGNMLANCAYNLAQAKGEPLSAQHAQSLDECRKEWDAAREALGAAINAEDVSDTERLDFVIDQKTSWYPGRAHDDAAYGVLCYGPDRKEATGRTMREAIDNARRRP